MAVSLFVDDETEIGDWRDFIEEILTDIKPKRGHDHARLWIDGLVGSVNSHGAIVQRIDSKALDTDFYEHLRNHPKFESYVASRAYELYENKRAPKSRRKR